jgi:AraC family transcriptional regulator, transcriptional activator of the genes for pyochelin and ferripyochelin receptors
MQTQSLRLDYKDIANQFSSPIETSSHDFCSRVAEDGDFGSYREASFTIGDVRINLINADFIQPCDIKVQNEFLNKSVHICMPLSGSVGGNFHDAGITSILHKKDHHYVYTPGSEYELKFEKKVALAHIEFGLSYYTSLLCHSEEWSSRLHKKLSDKQVLYSGGGISCHKTQEVLHTILNCQLTGTLRKIFLEAKLLELVSLQLEHYNRTDVTHERSLKKVDLDTMHDIHRYLSQTFEEEHSLKSLSRQFAINEFKLKRNFKMAFGQTIFEFIFDLKMNHAKMLVLEKEMLVNEVARMVGYKNANHFSTAFVKKFGVNPSTLRKTSN